MEIREELDESLLLDGVASGALDLTFASVGAARAAAARLRDAARGSLRAAHAARQPVSRAHDVTLHELDGLDVIEPPVGVSCDRHALARVGGRRRDAPDRLPHRRQPHGRAHGRRGRRARARARAGGRGRASTPTSRSCRVQGEGMMRRIAIFWHRDRYRSSAGETFVEIAREVVRADHATRRLTRPHACRGGLSVRCSRGHPAGDRARRRAGAHGVPAGLEHGAPAHRAGVARLGGSRGRLHGRHAARHDGGHPRLLPRRHRAHPRGLGARAAQPRDPPARSTRASAGTSSSARSRSASSGSRSGTRSRRAPATSS